MRMLDQILLPQLNRCNVGQNAGVRRRRFVRSRFRLRGVQLIQHLRDERL